MNMNKLLQQAQKMQKDMQSAQKEIEQTIFSESFQEALVIEAYGSKKIKKIKINKDLVDLDDLEMLEDTIASTFNKLMNKIDEHSEKNMSKFGKGMGGNLPF